MGSCYGTKGAYLGLGEYVINSFAPKGSPLTE